MSGEILRSVEKEQNFMFKYVTSNDEKIKVAKERLTPYGITFEPFTMDLIEPQLDNVMDIALAKAEQAFQALREPVVVSDHGWSISALNGFPGPYMKHINEWFTSDDFLNLMRDKQDKRIVKIEALVYKDQEEIKEFISETNGRILLEARGKGSPIMTVVTFSKSDKSVAEMWDEGRDPYPKNKIWDTFAEWYGKARART